MTDLRIKVSNFHATYIQKPETQEILEKKEKTLKRETIPFSLI